MIIQILDRISIGADTPLDAFAGFGEVRIYEKTEREELCDRIAEADILILNKVRLDAAAFAAAKKLKLVCVFATGVDNIDLSAARERGVAVCNVPGYSTESVTQFTLAKVLSLSCHLPEYRAYVCSGAYSASGLPNRLEPVYHEIAGKTWGIIGYGNIGRAVGKVAQALGARLLVCKQTPVSDVSCVDADTLCRMSDIITIHCPLNEKTERMIDERRISLMKPGVLLVNEARGAVLDEAAVARAVAEGRIGAFGCDVYAREPFAKDHPYTAIASLPNVCLTPHAAWGSWEARARCAAIIAENIEAYLRGEHKNRAV